MPPLRVFFSYESISAFMFHMTRATVPALTSGRPAAGLLLEDHRIEHLLDDLFGLRVEARDGLELELEGFIRPALILIEK